MSDDAVLEQTIASAHTEGCLLPWLSEATGGPSCAAREKLFDLVARMHDAGRIDAIQGLLDPALDWDSPSDWLGRQQVITELLPRLATSVDRLTLAIEAVPGQTIRHVLDDAFLAWCHADPGRADQVIASVDGAEPQLDRFVLAALIAGLRTAPERFLGISSAMAKGEHLGGRHLGARALGAMPATDDVSVTKALDALGSIVRDRGLAGPVRADALSASVDIAVRASEAAASPLGDLLRLASDDANPLLLEKCAEAFARHARRLSPSLFERLREVLPRVDATRTQAIRHVDMGLMQLLSASGDVGRAIEFIEAMLLREGGALSLGQLDSTRHQLSSGGDQQLGRVVVRWLLSGEAALGRAAADLVEGVHDREPLLAVDPGIFQLTDTQAAFLARKAVGWLFIKPSVAASLLLSLLPQAGKEAVARITELLFDPLLLSYPGSVRRLIDATASGLPGVAPATLDQVLVRHDAHRSAIEAVGRVPELHQSERNRSIEAQREMDGFEEARRIAEAQSIVRHIAHRSLLLHGARSVSYVQDFGSGDWRRIDSALGRVGVEMELPMQLTFDPMGLERTLSMFRRERGPA